jgi:hypothetical protein
MKQLLFSLVFFLAVTSFSESSVKAYLKSTEVVEGEALTLTVEVSGITKDEPDLTELKKSFDVISESVSTETRSINGVHSQSQKWTYEIFPKNLTANTQIPSIRVGTSRSAPIMLQPKKARSQAKEELSLTLTADQNRVYIHAEILVTVELKTALQLQDGSLSKPEIADAVIETLQEDEQKEEIIDGKKYLVIKRLYALYPTKIGSIEIPPINFEGVARDEGPRGFGFFSHGKRVRSRSQALKIEVMPVPKEFPADKSFLPLKSLSVVESFDNEELKLETNKATSRHFEIRALGAPAAFLPEIAAPKIAKLQIYKEAGQKSQKNTSEGLLSSLNISHIYMPLEPGPVEIPKQVIYWWDTKTNEVKTTEVQALSAVASGQAQATKALEEKKEPEEKVETKSLESAPEKDEEPFWRIFAFVMTGLWLFTMLFIFILLRKNKNKIGSQKINITKDISNTYYREALELAKKHDGKALLLILRNILEDNSVVLDNKKKEELRNLRSDLEAFVYQAAEHKREVFEKISHALESYSQKEEKLEKISSLYPL